MHLITIIAFAVLFLQAERPLEWVLWSRHENHWTLLFVFAQPLLLGAAAFVTARRARRLLVQKGETPQIAQRFHHCSTLFLKVFAILGFSATVLLTPWPEWFAFGRVTPLLQIIGDLIVLLPFFTNVLAIWLAAFPLERDMRTKSVGLSSVGDEKPTGRWRLHSYLVFNLRHQVLIVAVPMTLILFAADLLRGYERRLQEFSRWRWTPDVLLGAVAVGVFVIAPIMLTRIWRTVPLEPGPLRERLEALCRRIGLRCRDILVWQSEGMMINAAVMGVFPPVRYVLLSDGLLSTMNTRQIEAVFAHEAGHVRHHHMQHFLLFAFVGWAIIAGLTEVLAWVSSGPNPVFALPVITVEGIGVAGTIVFWGLGFGWLSRRFERQADRFAAWCVTPPPSECSLPCSFHLGEGKEGGTTSSDGRVCATGAAVFTSALDRVALLNGIPHEERSWRHSSIGSRIRFLTSLAGDPAKAAGFDRLITRVKICMVTAAIIGLVVSVYYWMVVPEPAVFRLNAGVP